MEIEKSLGEKIHDIRTGKNISIAYISEQTKVNAVHLNLIENNKRLPSGDLLEKMSDIFSLNERIREELYLMLAKEKLKNNIPDKVLNKMVLGKPGMPDKFTERIEKDTKSTKVKIDKKKIDAVINSQARLTKEEVIELAKSLKQSVSEYLLLAEYIPDEFIELLQYKDMENLINGIIKLGDPVKIDRAINSLANLFDAIG
ncbi:MAG: helix-turn-helix domain-containing protein [bacterium]